MWGVNGNFLVDQIRVSRAQGGRFYLLIVTGITESMSMVVVWVPILSNDYATYACLKVKKLSSWLSAFESGVTKGYDVLLRLLAGEYMC